MCGNSKRENREIPTVPWSAHGRTQGRSVNLSEGTADMNAVGKSDESVVPANWANKTATAATEPEEGRDLTEGKYCRTVADAPNSESEQVSIRATREITTGSNVLRCDR